MNRAFAFIALAFLISLLGSKAHAYNFDGCYQLYQPSVMYPAFCLEGTNEEGIGGAGARLVVFHTNTDTITACGLSSGLKVTTNSFEFIQNNRPEIILKNLTGTTGRLKGDAILGKTELKFMKVDSESRRLLEKFHLEPRCRNLQVGELRKLR